MNIPIKKILLWIALLLLVLLIYSMWKLSSTEQQLEDFVKQELAPTDTSGGLQVKNIQIEVRRGQLHLNEVRFFARRDSLVWQSERLSLGIGTWKSLQMGILPTAYVLATIDETEITMNNLVLVDQKPLNASVNLYGSPFELFPIISEYRFPSRALRLEAIAGPFSSSLLQPLLQQTGFESPDFEADSIQVTVSIDPSTGRVALNRLHISGEEIPSVAATATLFYTDAGRQQNLSGALLHGARLEGSLRATLPPSGAFSVIPVGTNGAVGFDQLQWQFHGTLDSNRVDTPLHLHQHDIMVETPVLYPQPGTLGQLENALILFGIPTSSLPFQRFAAKLNTYEDGTFELEGLELKHINFRASFEGSLRGGSLGNLLEESVRGTIRLDEMSDDVRNAITSFETLLGWSLDRDGDAFLLPLETGFTPRGASRR